jgi:hypothetical protein
MDGKIIIMAEKKKFMAVAGIATMDLLEAWGIQTRGLRKAVITIAYDDLVIVDIEYLANEMDAGDKAGLKENYRLEKLL